MAAVKESAMSDRWPLLPQFLGLTIGIVIIASIAIGVFFLAQRVGASGRLLIAIGGLACGSRSTKATRLLSRAARTERAAASVDLPTPQRVGVNVGVKLTGGEILQRL
jgi:hypothetical protein